MIETTKDLREAQARMINGGRSMQELTVHPAFVYLLERIDDIVSEQKELVVDSGTWDSFIQNKGELKGLLRLRAEIDSIIGKGKATERSL